VRREDILKHPELEIMAESRESGVYMVMEREGREIYVTGHSEYAPDTLDKEYKRDLAKGLPIDMPVNYYRDGNPNNGPLVRWRSVANLLFTNWLNYYVYQATPFDINEIQ
jgi:homoserine O-succinyltransferase